MTTPKQRDIEKVNPEQRSSEKLEGREARTERNCYHLEIEIPKSSAHVENGKLVGDTEETKKFLNALGLTFTQVDSERFHVEVLGSTHVGGQGRK